MLFISICVLALLCKRNSDRNQRKKICLWKLMNAMMGPTGKACDSNLVLVPKVDQELDHGHRCQQKVQSRRQSEKPM